MKIVKHIYPMGLHEKNIWIKLKYSKTKLIWQHYVITYYTETYMSKKCYSLFKAYIAKVSYLMYCATANDSAWSKLTKTWIIRERIDVQKYANKKLTTDLWCLMNHGHYLIFFSRWTFQNKLSHGKIKIKKYQTEYGGWNFKTIFIAETHREDLFFLIDLCPHILHDIVCITSVSAFFPPLTSSFNSIWQDRTSQSTL